MSYELRIFVPCNKRGAREEALANIFSTALAAALPPRERQKASFAIKNSIVSGLLLVEQQSRDKNRNYHAAAGEAALMHASA